MIALLDSAVYTVGFINSNSIPSKLLTCYELVFCLFVFLHLHAMYIINLKRKNYTTYRGHRIFFIITRPSLQQREFVLL